MLLPKLSWPNQKGKYADYNLIHSIMFKSELGLGDIQKIGKSWHSEITLRIFSLDL